MKLGMFTLKSDAVWVPPTNRPLFSTAQAERTTFVAPPAEPSVTGSSKPSWQPTFEDEATWS